MLLKVLKIKFLKGAWRKPLFYLSIELIKNIKTTLEESDNKIITRSEKNNYSV
ncbi:hypothetical protein CNEO4_1320001 [Clostridium neonatale]|nr:hypothetical protein CNEO4_1320001 [Clostridium neonatale]CAI3593520.1 hypothetical protein CNEO4_1400001 [Clostridium neonatale]